MRLRPTECWTRLGFVEHGVLSTLNRRGTIDAVPVCFAAVGEIIVSPVDRIKPKETSDLARVSNARRTGTATLLCEHWDALDWDRLWWVRAHLVLRADAETDTDMATHRVRYEAALRQKYAQYRDTEFADLLVFDVERLLGWTAVQARPM